MESGTKLGHYEISTLLGKGGMGEVWRAKDTKLGREVAIKTLPEEFAKDEDRLARFEREAKLLASLNHPNIAAIHGFEEDNGTHFLVLELVEGDTLADQIKRGAIPVEESLKLASQIAEALEAAHEKGVIHRDLKPSNIKVTDDGKVKVLDFGLAKAFEGDAVDASLSNSPTLSMQATQQGVILGTAAYMSPEQTRGRDIDKRTDVWAFGCVLYEMLTGRSAFQGEDVTEILASVIKTGADFELLPANINPAVSKVLSRCLEKDTKKRFRDIGDVQFELEQISADPSSLLVQSVTEVVPAVPKSKVLWIAIVAVSVGGLIGWLTRVPTEIPQRVRRFSISFPTSDALPPGTGRLVVLSPDGQTLVYRSRDAGVFRLYQRLLDQFESTEIPGTEGVQGELLFFSANGQWVGFKIGGTLMKVELAGGRPVRLAEVGMGTREASWGPDDSIIVALRSEGLARVPGTGGEPVSIITPEGDNQYWYPQVLASGGAVLFTDSSDVRPDAGDVMILDLETEAIRTLVQGGVAGQVLPTGHLVFVRRGDLWAIGFPLCQCR